MPTFDSSLHVRSDISVPSASFTPVQFTADATRLSTDHDVVLAYQIFLGRDPESSFVIREKVDKPISELINDFVGSPEFDIRLQRCLDGTPTPGPTQSQTELTSEHVAWLQSVVALDPAQSDAMKDVASWEDLLRMFVAELSAAALQPALPLAPSGADETILAVLQRIELLLRELCAGIADLRSRQCRPGEPMP